MESPPQTQSLPPGTRLEEFVIERVLGAGGFGITYLARDLRLDRQVVIKENLPAQFCFRDPSSLTVAPRHTHGDDADNFAWSLENFSREAAILASLDHPGIVKVLRSFEAFGTAYFVMPFVEGVPLDELAKQRAGKPFTEDELRGLLERVLDALDHLHAKGIYHRDIKPGNLLITQDGLPVLIDFGSARQRLGERSMTVVESAGYTPFEQLQSRGNVGPWSDLYALGATLVKLITGESPPKANDRTMGDPWRGLVGRNELVQRFGIPFLGALDRALQLRIEDRWQNSAEWKEMLLSGNDAVPMAQPVRAAAAIRTFVPGEEKVLEIAPRVEMTFCWIPPGEFVMRSVDETLHRVTISKGFWMAKTEVTQAQWRAGGGIDTSERPPGYWDGKDQLTWEDVKKYWNRVPADFRGETLPVERLDWSEARDWCLRLNERLRNAGLLEDGWAVGLPTEAQWEYACCVGKKSTLARRHIAPVIRWVYGFLSLFWSALNYVCEIIEIIARLILGRQITWHGDNSDIKMFSTYPVCKKQPNAWGLHDMDDNVSEWCADLYGEHLIGLAAGPTGPAEGADRVACGGNWFEGPMDCRYAVLSPDTRKMTLGLRPVLSTASSN